VACNRVAKLQRVHAVLAEVVASILDNVQTV
jgi:hypothetical protein